MAHLYKVSEFQGGSGRWYCNDISELAGVSSEWWAPARLLNMNLDGYVATMVNKFNAKVHFNGTNAIFYWDKYSDCHKYVLWINKQSRQNQWII